MGRKCSPQKKILKNYNIFMPKTSNHFKKTYHAKIYKAFLFHFIRSHQTKVVHINKPWLDLILNILVICLMFFFAVVAFKYVKKIEFIEYILKVKVEVDSLL